MKIRYDTEADALYIDFERQGKVSSTKELAEDYLLDVDAKGRPLGLEILFVSEKTGKRKPSLQVERAKYPALRRFT